MALLLIFNYPFHLEDQYTEGHVLTAGEAQVLNFVRNTNIKNNCDGFVKSAIEAAAAQGRPELTQDEINALQSRIAQYSAEYALGARAMPEPVLPIWSIARQVARENLLSNGFDPTPQAIKALITNPKILRKAREILRIQNSASSEELDEILESL